MQKRKQGGPGRPFEKGHTKGGRPKGCRNKIGNDLRQFVLDVAEELNADPEAGLLAWAKANPGEFWSRIFLKLLPKPIDINVKPKLDLFYLVGQMGPIRRRETHCLPNAKDNSGIEEDGIEEVKLLPDRSGG